MTVGPRCLAVAALGAALVAGGCAVPGEAVDADQRAILRSDDIAALDEVLGDDRLARAIRAQPHAIPYDLDGVEAMLGIGRACARTDSKEIWVVEEKSSRLTGEQVLTSELLPRLVVGGCNRHPSSPAAMRETFELFLAVVSDPARDPSDPLSTVSVEAMALDDTTGLYNFYVLEPPAPGGTNGTVTRFVKSADGAVMRWQKVSGRPATKEPNADRACYRCHVHGDPIMNELSEPWTNWVSSHKRLSRQLSGASRELVSEARPFGDEHRRSSLANQLEQLIRASIATWVEGTPGQPGSGLGAQVLDGKQPGGVRGLLRSVLCETTVNYESAFDTVPIALFADPSLAAFANLEPPIAPSSAAWTLLPVRSEVDLRVERFLQKARVLRPDTVLAARLLDDARAIFSVRRCAVHAMLPAEIPTGADVDALVRDAVLAAATADPTLTPATRRFVRALVDPSTSADERDAAEAAYVADLGARVAADASKLDTPSGRSELAARWLDRQTRALALFPTAANPLPITPASSRPSETTR